jgi:putative spermidine/putrescine transport system permease protein
MTSLSLRDPHLGLAEKLWYVCLRLLGYGLLAFLMLPIVAIIPLSFNDNSFLGYPMTGFTLRWYEELLTSADWLGAAGNSFIIAPAAALLATVLGVLGAIGLDRCDFAGKRALVALLLSPIVTPLVVVAVGMYFFFNRYGLSGSYVGLILAHAALGAPMVLTTMLATLKNYDKGLARASRSLGASPWQTFRYVTFPAVMPGVLTGAVFAFALSFDEVVVTLFLAGPAQTTIPRQMFSGIRDNINPTIVALATLLILLTVALFGALAWIRRRGGGSGVR